MKTFEEYWNSDAAAMSAGKGMTERCRQAFHAGIEAAKPRWIPVSDGLPTEMQPCVVKVEGNSCPLVRFYLTGNKKWLSVSPIKVTHWMELPN